MVQLHGLWDAPLDSRSGNSQTKKGKRVTTSTSAKESAKNLGPEMISKQGIIEGRRGWTETSIRDFLGDPDKLKSNPRYRRAAPIHLWYLSEVEKVEETKEWKQRAEEIEKRRQKLTS